MATKQKAELLRTKMGDTMRTSICSKQLRSMGNKQMHVLFVVSFAFVVAFFKYTDRGTVTFMYLWESVKVCTMLLQVCVVLVFVSKGLRGKAVIQETDVTVDGYENYADGFGNYRYG